jgi:transposase
MMPPHAAATGVPGHHERVYVAATAANRDKDIEILSLRQQLALLGRQLDGQQVRFEPVDRAWLAGLLHPLPRPTLRRLLVRPTTVLTWHRDLIARRHAALSRPRRRGRPRTLRSIRALVLRLARENGSWGYWRVQGELFTLGITVAPSTVWEILREAGIDPAPDRATTTWTDFLRSQANALLAADFIETVTLTEARMYIRRATARDRLRVATQAVGQESGAPAKTTRARRSSAVSGSRPNGAAVLRLRSRSRPRPPAPGSRRRRPPAVPVARGGRIAACPRIWPPCSTASVRCRRSLNTTGCLGTRYRAGFAACVAKASYPPARCDVSTALPATSALSLQAPQRPASDPRRPCESGSSSVAATCCIPEKLDLGLPRLSTCF